MMTKTLLIKKLLEIIYILKFQQLKMNPMKTIIMKKIIVHHLNKLLIKILMKLTCKIL